MIPALREWLASVRQRSARARSAFAEPRALLSYAQCGEDLVLLFLFQLLGIQRPSYLDLGAHDPVRLSNTFLFYQRGARGVCVDANPRMVERLRRRRPHDVCVHAAVVPEPRPSVRLYVTEDDAMSSTLDPAEGEPIGGAEAAGMAVERVLDVPALTLGEIAERYCPHPPELLSIDLEGVDLEVLRSVDLERWRPRVICAETFFAGQPGKCRPLIDHLAQRGYQHYADTFLNDVFLDYDSWHATFPFSASAAAATAAAAELAAARFAVDRNAEHHREAARYAQSLEEELARHRDEYARLQAAFAQHQAEAGRYVESLRAEIERLRQTAAEPVTAAAGG